MKNFTVENIVNKYINFLEKNPIEGEYIMDGDGSYSPIQHGKKDAPSQLTAELYKRKRGDNADAKIVSFLSVMYGGFSTNAITQEEVDFLLENYEESIEFLCSCNPKMRMRKEEFADWSDIFDQIEENIDFKPGSRIYVDPFDMGELAIRHPECHFSGYCRHPELLRIRLDAHNIHIDIRDSDFHRVMEEDVNSYDVIILDAMQEIGIGYESAICGWERVNENGQMFIRCGLELLQGGAEAKHFREVIQETKSLSKVFFYPKKQDNLGFEKNSASLVIDRSKVNETITMCQIETDESKVLSTTMTIKEREVDYNLLFPAYYMQQSPQNSTPLSMYCRIYREKAVATMDRKPIVPQLLSSNFSTAELDNIEFNHEVAELLCDRDERFKKHIWNRLPETTSPNPYVCVVINQPCVIVYSTGKEIKIGYITTPRENGYMLYGVECLIPQDGVSVQDLAMLLLTESVSKQMKSMTIGDARLSLTDEKLSKIAIVGDKEGLIKERLISELVRQREEIKFRHDEYKKTIRMRKHSLGQIMFELNTCWELIKISQEDNNGCLDENYIIGKKHPKRVGDIMKSITSSLLQLGVGIDNFVPEEDVRFAKKETFDLLQFVKEYSDEHQNPNFTFEIEEATVNASNENDVVETNYEITFSKTALKEILQNIIYNAEKHGFTVESKENKIKFSIEETPENIRLVISNNGNPISDEVKLDDLFMYGFTTKRSISNNNDGHSGIGLFFVKSLMCDSNGDITCVRNYEKDYPVSFILKFNKTI